MCELHMWILTDTLLVLHAHVVHVRLEATSVRHAVASRGDVYSNATAPCNNMHAGQADAHAGHAWLGCCMWSRSNQCSRVLVLKFQHEL